jgi:hypothetical protein
MLFMISLVCFFSCVGGILLGQSLKAMFIFKDGLEKGQRKMFNAGLISIAAALVISLASLLVNCMGTCHP